ncbi:sodium:solute symporter [Mangrovibacterium lignilyticum]|uniref:sodium:solute symporter n=1 Tax=Mangrovibacterium lignilyticum TaxID=2668052 RepID=UPI0013D3D408|nr:sodium:solute symporter [Mangrovibacterium lignilyticum]
MSTLLIAIIILSFFAVLMGVSWFTSRNADGETFFTGNRRSPWYLVAFGMIGSTISGVTFISVPGEVGSSAWTYFQFLLGNFVGYWVIALVLIPLYYRLNLISIYTYLDQRFGLRSYKTGAFFFLVSQTIGASFRLYLAAGVLQIAFFNDFGIPFSLTVLITLFLIWIYTYRAGIKTVVWTDSLQTVFILGAVGITIWVILKQLDLNFGEMVTVVDKHPYSQIFDWDWRSKTNFFKQFIAGVGIVLTMNGLDQNMMQKNLTCKTQRDAQKNVFWFSFAFIIANIFFLSLGVMLYYYAEQTGVDLPARTDDLFPLLAMKYFGPFAGALFLLGILSAAYSSADSALTALTTSFCVDFLNLDTSASKSKRTRILVHVGFSFLMFLVIIVFRIINNESVVSAVFRVAGYTYGPLLGLFSFGILTKKQVKDRFVPILGLGSPLLTYVINAYSETWFWGYKFGFELLLLNGLIMFVGLWLLSEKNGKSN